MTVLVDTSVWSLALRRDAPPVNVPEVAALRGLLEAASLRNTGRRAGVRVGTIDALLAQLCIRHKLILLTTDKDFHQAARHCTLQVWKP
jgi:predicted nucleic acid-binding protein